MTNSGDILVGILSGSVPLIILMQAWIVRSLYRHDSDLNVIKQTTADIKEQVRINTRIINNGS